MQSFPTFVHLDILFNPFHRVHSDHFHHCPPPFRYEKVKESEVVEARKLRAQTIIDEEALMSDADRANPEYFPRYLQVLRATEQKEEVWAGLSGTSPESILAAQH